MNNLKAIKKALSIIKPTSTILPILECALIMDNQLTITDLNTTVIFKEVGIQDKFVIPAKEFVKAASLIENPTFIKENAKLIISGSDGEQFSYGIEEIDNYPKTVGLDAIQVGEISISDATLIKRALQVIGNDELRPAMEAVAIKDGFIMATDAHSAIYEKSEFQYKDQILIGRKAGQLIGMMPNAIFKISISEKHIKLENYMFIILQRINDNKFPDLLSVVPKDLPITVSINKAEFLTTIKKAQTCTPRINKTIVLDTTERLTISAENIDDNMAYKRQINCTKAGVPIKIGFNVNLLIKLVNTIKTPEITIKMEAGNKPSTFNDTALLMPVMMNHDSQY